MNHNLYCMFKALVDQHLSPALQLEDGHKLSYAQLDKLAAQMSAALKAQNVKPGDRVAVQVTKTAEALALYLACLRCGAIYLPMNTAYTADEVHYILSDAEPALFIHDPATHHEAPCPTLSLDATGTGSLIDALSVADPDIFDAAADDIAAILYTSGTTGRPKGAMLSHENLSSNAKTLSETWHFSTQDVLLHTLPIFHAHGLFVAANIAFLMGIEMLFLQNFDAEKVVKYLPRASVYMGVPTHYTRLLKCDAFTKDCARHMRLFVSGSAPLLPESFKAFEERTGHQILERYGMTETVMNCSNPYEGPRLPGSVGPALPGIEARLADKDGDVGVLQVRGPNVFKGYWRKPDITKESFTEDGFFITGDLAQMDDDGRVWLVGRAKDMIISGGFNVYPLEIEEQLNAQAGVDEAAVIGVPHDDFGEAVIAVYTGSGAKEDVLKEALRSRLASYKLPKRFLHVNALPRNTMGKVEKAKLRAQYHELFRD
ncbi:MAG: AMP-binding protein [Sphingomonadales bacterium]|jgi:malonyl-CoA/methylmalonyl-CoA synthetase